jgi:molybdopterin-guanine dinucleotide biosynthesis protein A
MGTDKAFLPIGGVAMVSLVRDAMVQAGASDVVAIGGDRERLGALGLATRADSWPGEGPLGGIIDALSTATEPIVVVMACDQPAVDADLVRRLVDALGGYDAAVPVIDGRAQPLTAAYAARAVDALRAVHREGERAPRRALQRLRWHAVDDIDPARVDDVDDPDDLARYAAASRSSRRDGLQDPRPEHER